MNSSYTKIALAVLCLLPLIPIWYFDYLPLQDYPNHLARLNILSDYEHSDFYKKKFSLIPFKLASPLTHTYMGLDLFVNKLMPFLDINIAMKVFISLYVIMYISGIYLLANQLKQDFRLLLLINAPLIYSSFFYLGFLNFLFSIPVFLFTVWAIDRYMTNRNVLNLFLMLFLMLLVYLSHIFTFAILCILLFCRMATGGLKTREYISVAAIISIFLILNINFLSDILRHKTLFEPFFLKLTFLTFPFSHLPTNLLIIASALFTSAVCMILISSPITNKFYLTASVVFFLLYLILPFKRALAHVDVRAFLFSLILLPLSFNIREGRYTKLARLILLSVFLLNLSWILFFFSDFNKNFSTRCADKIEQGSIVLPIDATKSKSAVIRPYIHSWGYFLNHKEFLTPYLFTGSHIGIEHKNKPPAPSEWWVILGDMDKGAAFMNTIKDTYDYILIVGSSPEAEEMIGSISYEVCSDRSVRLFKIEKDNTNCLQ